MEKVQSETWVGAMTPEQILELAHEAGFPRDTIFYRSDQFITFANAIAQRTRDALKAQAGEPVGYHFSYTTPFGHVVWDIDYTPRPDAIECYPLVRAHPTTEHPYNPLNDYAVISMNPTEPVKAQAGEPDFYVRRRPSPGYEVVSSSDPMAQPAYLHSTTERPYNPLNDYAVISMPTTERRVIPEELITRIKQTANRWANRSYDCGNRDGMGYQSSTPAKLMDQSRDDFNELIEELRNALNAAPAKGEV